MKEYNYTLTTSQTAATAGSASSGTLSLTGTNNVIFSLSGIDQQYSTINKVIAEFPNRSEQVFTRTLTANVSSLTATTFNNIFESEVQNDCSKEISFFLHRDDGFIDTHVLTFNITTTNLEDYTDVNLIKSEFLSTDTNSNNLVLTFNADDPNITGVNLIDFDEISNSRTTFYGTSGTAVSALSSLISLHADTVITNAGRSNLKGLAIRSGDNSQRVTVKFTTRVPTVTTELVDYGDNTSRIFSPAIPNTTFFHTSGQIVWHANEEVQVKSFNIPLIDSFGAYISANESAYFHNYFSGETQTVSANYFFVDLFDLSGCEAELCECSTLTAYINY